MKLIEPIALEPADSDVEESSDEENPLDAFSDEELFGDGGIFDSPRSES